MSAWISALAPTSTPRVGSSRISTRQRAASHFASTIFCWLPPDSPAVIASMPAPRTPRRSDRRRARIASAWRRIQPKRASAGKIGSVKLCAADIPSTSPWRLRSSGTRPRPARIAARGDDRRIGLPSTSTRPVACAVEPEQRLRDLGAARADQPGQADHLARADRQRDVAELARARQPLDAQQLRSRRRRHVRRQVLVEPAADHQVDQLGLVEACSPAAW